MRKIFTLSYFLLLILIAFSLNVFPQSAPVISDIENQTIKEGQSFNTIDLDEVVTDPDNSDEELIWEYSENIELQVSIENHVATIEAPDENWFGEETIVFTVFDPDFNVSTDEATFTVSPSNDSPVISGIPGEEILQGSAFTVFDLDNYVTDIDNDPTELIWSAKDAPHLMASIDGSHNVSITSNDANWSGSETIIFTVEDPSGDTDNDRAVYTVTDVEYVPVAQDDSYSVDEGNNLSTPAPGVLSNDSDADGDPLSAILVDPPSHSASFDLNDDGSFEYTHDGSRAEDDAFTYRADDNKDQSNIATVTITINQINDVPVANPDAYGVNEGGTLTISTPGVLENDTDGDADILNAELVDPPSNADDFSFNADGSFTYTHDGTETTEDSFTYQASDGADNSVTATVTITINPQNDPPVAEDDDYLVAEGATLNVSPAASVLANDIDPENNTLIAIKVTDPMNGTLTLNSNGSFTYVHNGSETTSDQFTYRAYDGTDNSNIATVSITITGDNDPPVVSDIPNQTIAEGVSFTNINLDDFVSDPDHPDNQIDWTFSGNSQLTVTISTSRVATISIPSPDWNGSETITFTATDPADDFDSDQATFTVTNTNDPPVVSDIPNQSIDEGGSFTTINLDDFVSDPDHSDNQIVWTYSGNTQLMVTISPARVATIGIPSSDWNGSETITFTATDPADDFDSDQATFTVTNTNDPPVVSDIPNQSIDEGGSFTTINLDDFVSDPDHSDNQINWTFSGNTQLTVTISTSRVATISIPSPDWNGSETITFTATDEANGSHSDQAIFTVTNVNDPPEATNVIITAPNNRIGTTHTGSFVFTDPDGDDEGSHTYKWYISDFADGSNANVIPGAASNVYVPVIANFGKYLGFEVIPSDEHGLSGLPVKSVFVGPLNEYTANITGSTEVCPGTPMTITLNINGGFPPYEARLRPTGSPSDIIIYDIVSLPASIEVDDPGIYTLIEVSDNNGEAADISNSQQVEFTIKTSPFASISGSDSICPGETAFLAVTLTSGNPPWSFSYQRNGVAQGTINNINNQSHNIPVTETGVYTLSLVTNEEGTGCVTGEAVIANHTPPTAVISGTTTICEHTTADLNVVLTGKSPWRFGYNRNMTQDPTVVENVFSSPKTFKVSKGGTYRLYEVIDRNGCSGNVSGSAAITVTPAPEVSISGLSKAYNFEVNDYDTIIGTPPGGTYAGPGVLSNFFLPRIAGLGTHNITYQYRVSPTSCYGYDTAVVSVIESDALIVFDHNRTKYCANDEPFMVRGVNLEDVEGHFTISGGAGITDHQDNSATVYPAGLEPNKYTLTYSYQIGEKYFFEYADFDIGPPPHADFNWASECFHAGEPINFNNTSTSSFGFLTDTSYYWKISTNFGFDSDSSRNTAYTFPKTGVYQVELKITNSYGCGDTIVKSFNLRPTVVLSKRYYESFELNPISWQSSAETQSNSWKLGNPSRQGNPLHGFNGAFSDTSCWYTHITKTPGPIENSWVTSPCFDFSATNKPMLSMQIWRLFNSNRDGANIQVTADSGKTWNLVGEIGDGENWFNTSFIRGEPGGKDNGWSNYDGINNDGGWIRARHGLDFLKGKKDVQFKIAYGSDGTPQNNDGIAFDDFVISDRTKMVLLEHFSNTGSPDAEKADSIVDLFAEDYGMHAIDVQYHTPDPSGDPFYEDNTEVPTSRLFYYGLSEAPYALIDGGSNSKHLIDFKSGSKPFDKNTIIRQSLSDSKFEIRVNASRSGNTLNGSVFVRAENELPLMELSVRTIIVESLIQGISGTNGDTVFRNVVRAMLPDVSGIVLYQSWNTEDDDDLPFAWEIKNVTNVDNLLAVAFIQNETTREIYNVDMVQVSPSTGAPDQLSDKTSKAFSVYPNPTDRYAVVMLDNAADSDITLEMFSNTGSLVYTTLIPRGQNTAIIPAGDFSDGLYVLRLISMNKLLGISKLIVTK